MNLGFLDRAHGGWVPNEIGVLPLSAETEALAGLAIGLAGHHAVTVFHRTDRPAEYGNLRTVRSVGLKVDALRGLDAVIAVDAWDPAAIIGWRRALSAPVIAWSPSGDAAIADLEVDGWAFPSEWALQQALRRKALPDERTFLWRPTVLPGLEPRLGDTAVRTLIGGGPWLTRLWPAIREAIPGIRGFTLGGQAADGLEVVPDAPADRIRLLRRAAIWVEAPESEPAASRAVLEALAAGCEVVAVQRGGIWEQCCGFGRFVGPPLSDVDARLVQRIHRSYLDPRRPARMSASAAWAAATQSRAARAADVARDLAWIRSFPAVSR